MELSANARKVLQARYLLKDERGCVIETPAEMFRRVARAVAEAERLCGSEVTYWEERFHEHLSALRFLPNSPTFMNAVPPEDHIEMQAAFQEFTDNAVSKTINLPFSASKADVAAAYLLAYAKGVKGITVFRYGAKKGTLVKFADAD